MRTLFRAPLRSDPQTGRPLESAAYTTFAMHAPVRTHFIELPCKVAQCRRYVHGWVTTLDPGREEHLPLIQHIVSGRSGRRWSRGENTPEGYMTFVFPPGQACFRNSHHQRDESKQELYVVRRGDFRMPYAQRESRVMGFDNWIETFDKNQKALVKAHEARME
jgi:hypothetical protein